MFSNRKTGSERSKSINFRIVFSLIFHVFSDPPSRGPEIRRHQPVSGVVNRRSQHQRSATIGGLPSYLPAPPQGIKMASMSNFFSASNFGIIFGMPFFMFFWFVDRFGLLFWLHFGIILHYCCMPFSSTVFASILYVFFLAFSMPRTMFSIRKTNSFSNFAFFRKAWKIINFGIHFGIILETFWHPFWYHRFLHAFLDAIFSKFWCKMAPKTEPV